MSFFLFVFCFLLSTVTAQMFWSWYIIESRGKYDSDDAQHGIPAKLVLSCINKKRVRKIVTHQLDARLCFKSLVASDSSVFKAFNMYLDGWEFKFEQCFALEQGC